MRFSAEVVRRPEYVGDVIDQCGELIVVVAAGALIGGISCLAAYIIITRTVGALGHALNN